MNVLLLRGLRRSPCVPALRSLASIAAAAFCCAAISASAAPLRSGAAFFQQEAAAAELAVSPAAPTAQTPLTLTATLSAPDNTPAAAASGAISFQVDGVAAGNVALASGVAALVLPALPAGEHTFACTYAGDASFAPATCPAVTLALSVPTPTLQLSVGATTPFALSPFSVTAHLAGASGAALPALPVTVLNDTQVIASAGSDASGNVTASTTVDIGTHIIAAATGHPASSTAYRAFGDSITSGIGVSTDVQRYSFLTGNILGLTTRDQAFPGDEACDIFPHSLGPEAEFTPLFGSPLYSVLIGTNDADVGGAGAYEATFKACHSAVLAWLGTPRETMVVPGDAALSGSGGWTAAPQDYFQATRGALGSSRLPVAFAPVGAAGSLAAKVTTTGAPIYLWYVIDDLAAASDCFTLAIDGQSAGATYCTRPATLIATQNHTTASIALVRIPVTAGAHTVTASTTTGGVALAGVGTLPAPGTWAPPIILSHDVPVQQPALQIATPATQLAYTADVIADETPLRADGMLLLHVNNRTYMTGDPTEMADGLHPNALGNEELFLAQMNTLAAAPVAHVAFGSSTVTGVVNTTAVTMTTSTTTVNPGQSLSATITVTNTSGTAAPVGWVGLLDIDSNTVLAQQNLPAAPGPSASVTVTATTFIPGVRNMRAIFEATNPDFSTQGSSTVSITVVPPTFSVSTSSPSLTVTDGLTATVPLNVTPGVGFNGTVQLACGSLPTYVSCTFSPATVTTSGTPVSSTLTLSTSASTSASLTGSRGPQPFAKGQPRSREPLLATLAGLLLLPALRRRRLRALAVAVMAVALTSLVSGCSGAATPQAVAKAPQAAPGTYTIPVTATGPTGTTPQTIDLTVIVKA